MNRRRRWERGAVQIVASLLAVACSESEPRSESGVATAAAATPLGEDSRRCKPGPGTTGSPSTIAEAVALLNGLPSPVSAECFVEALDRPLALEATHSRSSVQPARGARSPRTFIFSGDGLIIAIALDGPGRDLIEFGQFVSPRRTVKGELEFPLATPVAIEAALEQVRNPDHPGITTCFVCHDAEKPSVVVPGGLQSVALRPVEWSLVAVDSLRREHEICDADVEPRRCAYLRALVGHGAIEHRAFPERLPTLFE